ncbi:MAG: hypothetical protein COB81_10820 [Flavobacteriaceae bacterium]|nr:MAG: hypothetical protein COB81_10820 [Flavobacteriaceae bacterium]
MEFVKSSGVINSAEGLREFSKETSTKFFRKGWLKYLVLGKASHRLLKPMMALPLEQSFLMRCFGHGS